MYTAEKDPSDTEGEMWMILDAKGNWLFTVLNKFQADVALEHLNKE